ncbi:MAG: patatin-like phospholipase family protein [Bdellovibrionaceae bacterium]|nr:patatin-like phospholipase family protein [Pseudobdellovibrionaceae bacterium]
MRGLVLSGGGARGAYQVGVLKAVGQICTELGLQNPFQIIGGVSAGAINAAKIAEACHDFPKATEALTALWSNLHSDNVFKTDPVSMGRIGLQWLGELSIGGLTGATGGRSLLDTSPLGKLLQDNLDFSHVEDRIREGSLYALGITAMDYRNSTTITFVQGSEKISTWERARRKSEKCKMRVEHILASSAIPLLFPPVALDHRYFGDGCIRNQAPCSPTLHMGADKLLVIGVRKQGMSADERAAIKTPGAPSVARIANVLLNSVMLDSIEMDIERLKRINEFLNQVPEAHRDQLNFRAVPFVFISPSADIGQIAARLSSKLPRVVRYLLKGLGPLEDASELISYLLFEPEFCRQLIELGYQDGMNKQEELKQFFALP